MRSNSFICHSNLNTQKSRVGPGNEHGQSSMAVTNYIPVSPQFTYQEGCLLHCSTLDLLHARVSTHQAYAPLCLIGICFAFEPDCRVSSIINDSHNQFIAWIARADVPLKTMQKIIILSWLTDQLSYSVLVTCLLYSTCHDSQLINVHILLNANKLMVGNHGLYRYSRYSRVNWSP